MKKCLGCENRVENRVHTCLQCGGTSFAIHTDDPEEMLDVLDAIKEQVRGTEHVDHSARLVEQGRFDEAEVELNKALESNPHNATAHGNMGWVLLNSGRPSAAIPWLQKALALNPDLDGVPEALERAQTEASETGGDQEIGDARSKVPCEQCGGLMLPATAARHDGLCARCSKKTQSLDDVSRADSIHHTCSVCGKVGQSPDRNRTVLVVNGGEADLMLACASCRAVVCGACTIPADPVPGPMSCPFCGGEMRTFGSARCRGCRKAMDDNLWFCPHCGHPKWLAVGRIGIFPFLGIVIGVFVCGPGIWRWACLAFGGLAALRTIPAVNEWRAWFNNRSVDTNSINPTPSLQVPARSEAASDEHDTVPCPYCERAISQSDLQPGDNTCPQCGRAFEVTQD